MTLTELLHLALPAHQSIYLRITVSRTLQNAVYSSSELNLSHLLAVPLPSSEAISNLLFFSVKEWV